MRSAAAAAAVAKCSAVQRLHVSHVHVIDSHTTGEEKKQAEIAAKALTVSADDGRLREKGRMKSVAPPTRSSGVNVGY